VFLQIVSSGTMQEPNISSNTSHANGGNERQHAPGIVDDGSLNATAKHVGTGTGNNEQNSKVVDESKASQGTPLEKAAVIQEVERERGVVTPNGIGDVQPQGEFEDESKYLSGFKLAILSVGLCLTTFVIALDNTIIATAIPKITSVFNLLDDVGRCGSSYLLTTTSLQPSFGKVYTYFDVKYTYLSALVIFEVGSVICAAATSSPMFIIGRAVAGAGAAALYSGGMTIIGYSVPLRKRAICIAALSSMFGIASVVRPILGGAFTDRL
jgi:fucose permease